MLLTTQWNLLALRYRRAIIYEALIRRLTGFQRITLINVIKQLYNYGEFNYGYRNYL